MPRERCKQFMTQRYKTGIILTLKITFYIMKVQLFIAPVIHFDCFDPES